MPRCLKCDQNVVGNKLVIEGDDIALGGQRLHCVEIIWRTNNDIAPYLRRSVIVSIGQKPDRNIKRDRRLQRHPGKLTGADNPGHCPGSRRRLMRVTHDGRIAVGTDGVESEEWRERNRSCSSLSTLYSIRKHDINSLKSIFIVLFFRKSEILEQFKHQAVAG